MRSVPTFAAGEYLACLDLKELTCGFRTCPPWRDQVGLCRCSYALKTVFIVSEEYNSVKKDQYLLKEL